MNGTPAFFIADGERFDYTLIRKKVKHLRLRVLPDGGLVLSVPMTASKAELERFLATTPPFIRRTREQMKSTPVPAQLEAKSGDTVSVFGVLHRISVEVGRRPGVALSEGQILLTVKNPDNAEERIRVLKDWMWAQVHAFVDERCRALLPLFYPDPNVMPALVFRQMTSRWGVCRPTRGQITFNCNLFFVEPALIDYVICHELAHFKHPDHSAAFWAHLAVVMPDCKARRAALRAIPVPRF